MREERHEAIPEGEAMTEYHDRHKGFCESFLYIEDYAGECCKCGAVKMSVSRKPPRTGRYWRYTGGKKCAHCWHNREVIE